MIQTNWCVITGAPCSGKTTTIKALEKLGYAVGHGVTRPFIALQKQKNSIMNNPLYFQQQVFKLRKEREIFLEPSKLVFLDRGIPDSIAYYKIRQFDYEKVSNAAKIKRYKHVLLLARLPLEDDGVRFEDDSRANTLEKLIEQSYSELGYKITHIPICPIQKRINLILDETLKITCA
ncbi:MAG: ATP-binding protein [Gammaproteobacteria bacterium]|jgi:predicted ATPase